MTVVRAPAYFNSTTAAATVSVACEITLRHTLHRISGVAFGNLKQKLASNVVHLLRKYYVGGPSSSSPSLFLSVCLPSPTKHKAPFSAAGWLVHGLSANYDHELVWALSITCSIFCKFRKRVFKQLRFVQILLMYCKEVLLRGTWPMDWNEILSEMSHCANNGAGEESVGSCARTVTNAHNIVLSWQSNWQRPYCLCCTWIYFNSALKLHCTSKLWRCCCCLSACNWM